jgi:hypothetical protein
MSEHIEQRGPTAVLFSSWYPENYLVAVIDDLAQAESAVRELLECGCREGDIKLFKAGEVLEAARALQRQRTFLASLVAAFQHTASEEGDFSEDYKQEAVAGHQILVVEAHAPDEVQRVRAILARRGAHDLRFYGHWTITDVP